MEPIEPARGENIHSENAKVLQRLFPDKKSFQNRTSPTSKGQKVDAPGRYRSARCGNPTPHRVIGD